MFLPIAISLFAFEGTQDIATRYVQQTLAILAWPIGFATVDLVGNALFNSLALAVAAGGSVAVGTATEWGPASFLIAGFIRGTVDPRRHFQRPALHRISHLQSPLHPPSQPQSDRQRSLPPRCMAIRYPTIIFALLLTVPAFAQSTPNYEAIKQFPLDDRTVYQIKVGENQVATVMFPGAINALEGANVTSSYD